MSWTDKIATQTILKLKDEFKIKTAVVTGVARGGDVESYGHYFQKVYGVDIDDASLEIARKRTSYLRNIRLYNMKSADFLLLYTMSKDNGITLFYLDAHYYDPNLKQKWVVADELKALREFPDCIIVIHDYNNGLGHLVYGGEHMGWNVVGDLIKQVNPHFHFYTNTRETCDIYNEQTIHKSCLHVDEHILDGLRYANTSDDKRYRGILYCLPRKIDLNKYQLKEGYE